MKYPGITCKLMHKCHVLGVTCTRAHTLGYLSVETPWQKDETCLRWARVWDREKKECWCSSYRRSSGCPAHEWSGKSSWEALRLTLYGNHTPAAVSRTLPLDLSWNRFTKQLLGPHRSTRVSLLYISISQTPKLVVCAVSQVLVLWAFSRNFSTYLIAWTFILL